MNIIFPFVSILKYALFSFPSLSVIIYHMILFFYSFISKTGQYLRLERIIVGNSILDSSRALQCPSHKKDRTCQYHSHHLSYSNSLLKGHTLVFDLWPSNARQLSSYKPITTFPQFPPTNRKCPSKYQRISPNPW